MLMLAKNQAHRIFLNLYVEYAKCMYSISIDLDLSRGIPILPCKFYGLQYMQ